jgi:hypothetical protein
MMQPPATGATHNPFLSIAVVENIDGNNVAFFAGGNKGRIIRKSEILTEPDYGWASMGDSGITLIVGCSKGTV